DGRHPAGRPLPGEAGARSRPEGQPFTDADIGSALALRDLLDGLRQEGTATGGPAPVAATGRSRFLSELAAAAGPVRGPRPTAPEDREATDPGPERTAPAG